ncbi:MAG: 2-C-methyl-D-erythritol 4-phosphate cytidylyltransferase [Bacteroidota bacterium]
MHSPQVAVIVPAAGKGTRLGGQRKQFRLLDGKPLLIRSLEVFQLHPEIDLIVVAVPGGEENRVQEALHAAGLSKVGRVVAGGASRQASVYEGLKAVPASFDYVLVHDGVRPFVAQTLVSDVVSGLTEHGAAALAIPVTDTLRAGAEDVFGQTRPRDGLYRMQTPQGCRRDWFLQAHQHAIASGIEATDDVDLVQRAGFPVHIITGSSLNIKITTKADWDLACIIWPAWQQEK